MVFSLLVERAYFPEQPPIDIIVPIDLDFKEYVGAFVADVFEIAVETLFRAFNGYALEPIGAGNVQLDEFQKAFGAEVEEFVKQSVGFHLCRHHLNA